MEMLGEEFHYYPEDKVTGRDGGFYYGEFVTNGRDEDGHVLITRQGKGMMIYPCDDHQGRKLYIGQW